MKSYKIREWAKENPLLAVKYVLSLFLEFLAGAFLGGVLVFGPLNQGFNSWIIIGGIFSGLMFTWVSFSFYQKSTFIYGAKRTRMWKLGLNLGRGIIIIVIVTIVFLQLYNIGMTPALSVGGSIEKELERLLNALEEHYPYADLKNINFEEMKKRYGVKVIESENDEAYFNIIRQMLLELDDAHTGLLSPSDGLAWFGLAVEIEGKAVITGVRLGLDIPGLEKGAVIKRIDGMDIESYIKEMSPWLRSGSTDRQQRYRAFTHLLTVTLEEDRVVTIKALDGEIYEIVLNAELIHNINLETAERDAVPQHTHNIIGKSLSSGIGLIEIPSFQGNRSKMIKEFDAVLDDLLDTPGIIIDLRGNGGGSTFIAHPIAGRFFAEPFIYGVEYYKKRLPLRGWAKAYEFGVKPRGEIYQGAIAVLVDTSNMSTAENFIAAMKDSGRAIIIGRPTAGSSGNPVTFNLVGGLARFSTGDLHRINGPRIEGVGFKPDILVDWQIEDIINERDPDIKTAEDYLKQTLFSTF